MKFFGILFIFFINSMSSFAMENSILLNCEEKYEQFSVKVEDDVVSIRKGIVLSRVKGNPFVRGSSYLESESDIYAKSILKEGKRITLTLEDNSTVLIDVTVEGDVKFSSANSIAMESLRVALELDGQGLSGVSCFFE